MKRITILIIILIFPLTIMSQSCLPDGIHFTTQAQIDSFQINYPNCSMLEGSVRIGATIPPCNINNLNGLNILTSIEGGLEILYTDSLSSLNGIENLTFIGEHLAITYNIMLTDISGLHGLSGTFNHLTIAGNGLLPSLAGLENISSITGNFSLGSNNSLTNLSGLDNLISIGGDFTINANANLEDLTGLNNLSSIGGEVWIGSNESLSNLSGLENVAAGSITSLNISYNDSLINCSVQSICDYLSSPNGAVIIHDNALGCNNPPEVATVCGVNLPCLPYGHYYFCSQAEINDFQNGYPNCLELEGNVVIDGNDIKNLNGLNEVTSIGGSLYLGNFLYQSNNDSLTNLIGLENLTTIGNNLKIRSNDMLESLEGLNNLHSIDGHFQLYNNKMVLNMLGLESLTYIGDYFIVEENSMLSDFQGLNNLTFIGGNFIVRGDSSLISLEGLENLSVIGGGLNIGSYNFGSNPLLSTLTGLESLTLIGDDCMIEKNGLLTSLTGLENLFFIGGNLTILKNDNLTNLTGLDNIYAGSIEDLRIFENPYLSTCEVFSICDYLSAPNGSVEIYDNAIGCNSPEEVQDSCEAHAGIIDEGYTLQEYTISPNPFTTSTTLSYTLDKPCNVQFTVYNVQGKIVETIQKNQEKGEQQVQWNAEGLPAGMYYFRIQAGERVGGGKMVKMD